MANKVTTISLNAVDQKVVKDVQRILEKRHGKVGITFIVREALRALEEKLKVAA